MKASTKKNALQKFHKNSMRYRCVGSISQERSDPKITNMKDSHALYHKQSIASDLITIFFMYHYNYFSS